MTGDDAGSWDWLDFTTSRLKHQLALLWIGLAAVAVGTAPHGYGAKPEIQENVKLLCGYLLRGLEAQTPINQAVVLWASSRCRDCSRPSSNGPSSTTSRCGSVETEGWALASLVGPWKRKDDLLWK